MPPGHGGWQVRSDPRPAASHCVLADAREPKYCCKAAHPLQVQAAATLHSAAPRPPLTPPTCASATHRVGRVLLVCRCSLAFGLLALVGRHWGGQQQVQVSEVRTRCANLAQVWGHKGG